MRRLRGLGSAAVRLRRPGLPGAVAARRLGRGVSAVLVLVLGWHVAMTFLLVAPANPVSREHRGLVDAWTQPLLRQNWQLFAPYPVSDDLELRARYLVVAGGLQDSTEWARLTPVRADAFWPVRRDRLLRVATTEWRNAAQRVRDEAGDQAASPDVLLLSQPDLDAAEQYRDARDQLERAVLALLPAPRGADAVQVEVVSRTVPQYEERHTPRDEWETTTYASEWWRLDGAR